jgi:hypothetical protein
VLVERNDVSLAHAVVRIQSLGYYFAIVSDC